MKFYNFKEIYIVFMTNSTYNIILKSKIKLQRQDKTSLPLKDLSFKLIYNLKFFIPYSFPFNIIKPGYASDANESKSDSLSSTFFTLSKSSIK